MIVEIMDKAMLRMLKSLMNLLQYIALIMLLMLLLILSLLPSPEFRNANEIAVKIKGLHETAAIWVPHYEIDGGKLRASHQSLFEKVETLQSLSGEESHLYRRLYQTLLQENQKQFHRFDSQLAALTDVGMNQVNNIGGHGIEGHHDHHDRSSRNNIEAVEKSYAVLRENPYRPGDIFSIERVKQALFIYKNLNDILFHLATVPHTKSIPYEQPVVKMSSSRELFESSLRHFKQAQFVDVNSIVFSGEIELALNDYIHLVEDSQSLVHSHLSSMELKLVGEWGGWQSLTPSVSERVELVDEKIQGLP